MPTIKPMRSVLICISPSSRMLTSKMLEIIATDYEMGKENGDVFHEGAEVARWMHYEGKLDKIPAEVDILITPTFDCDEVYYADVIRNYNSYDIPKWFVAKSENRREYMRQEDYQVWREHCNLSGSLVIKKTGKPFKSGNLCNTVSRIERNPYTGLWGFSFEDDDSVVDIKQLTVVMYSRWDSKPRRVSGTEQRYLNVADETLVSRNDFKSAKSYENFKKALSLSIKFMKNKLNKKLSSEYDNQELVIGYDEGSIFINLLKDGKYDEEIIPAVERDDEEQRTSVLAEHLKWFDFMKEF